MISSAIRFTPTVDAQNIHRIVGAVIDYNADFAIRGHLYISVDTTVEACIMRLANQDSPAADVHDYLSLDATRHLRVSRQGGVTNDAQSGATVLSVGVYYDWLLLGAAGTLTVYLDNALEATATCAYGGRAASAAMYAGGRSSFTPDHQFNGRLAQIRGWQSLITTGAGSENLAESLSSVAVKSGAWEDWRTPAGPTRVNGSLNGRDWVPTGTLTDEDGPVYPDAGAPSDVIFVRRTSQRVA